MNPSSKPAVAPAKAFCVPPVESSVWKGATYVEPPEWLHDIMLFDGTVTPAGTQAPQQD
jgi:hypothetical protein